VDSREAVGTRQPLLRGAPGSLGTRRKGSVVGGTMASAEHKPITSGLGAEPTTTNLSYRKQYALLRSTATGVRVGGPRVHGAPTSSLGGYA